MCEVCVCTNVFILHAAILIGKRKLWRFSLIRLPFAHQTKASLSFVRLLTKNQMEVIRFANGLNGLAHQCKQGYMEPAFRPSVSNGLLTGVHGKHLELTGPRKVVHTSTRSYTHTVTLACYSRYIHLPAICTQWDPSEAPWLFFYVACREIVQTNQWYFYSHTIKSVSSLRQGTAKQQIKLTNRKEKQTISNQ